MKYKIGDYIKSPSGMQILIRDEVHERAVNRHARLFERSTKEEYENYWGETSETLR